MIKKLLLLITILFTFNYTSAQLDSIYFHDSQMESQWGSSTVNNLFGCFVRFTPLSYPATLRGIRGYFRNADPSSTIKWKIYTDPNGLANGGVNTIYNSPASINNPAAGGVANQEYTSYVDLTSDNIVINSGDVYVGAVQSTGYFGMGIDNAPNNSVAIDRQWQWMNVFNVDYWNTLASQASNGQFGITAFFTPFTTNVNEMKESVSQPIINTDNHQLYIWFTSFDKNSILKLFDISGRQILINEINDKETIIDLNSLSKGIYIAVICSDKMYFTARINN